MYLEKMIMLLTPRKCLKDCNQLQKLKFLYGKFLQCVITPYEHCILSTAATLQQSTDCRNSIRKAQRWMLQMCKSRGVFFSFKHQIQSNHVSDADATNVALLSPEDNWSNSRPKEINEAAYGHSLHHYS